MGEAVPSGREYSVDTDRDTIAGAVFGIDNADSVIGGAFEFFF